MIWLKMTLGVVLIIIASGIHFSSVGPVSRTYEINLMVYQIITIAQLIGLFAYALFKMFTTSKKEQ